ncbi:MAG TPA: serine hydrolase domain-containing protein, partial [Candidatus Acidoferrales bacterium]|nr:serine hydrolase domain-containing protein [Candidatus Acidoferrales bacterium]
MRSLLIGRALVCAAALLLGVSAPQSAAAATSQPDYDAIAARTFAQGKLPGMAVAIVRNGTIVFEKGYGDANIAKNLPVSAETPFAVGSLTKQFTAVSVLMLAARGKLKLDDPISKYVASLPNAQSITLRQALWQVSGLHNYPHPGEHDWPTAGEVAPQKLFALLATDNSDFPPGSRWAYSNTNYAVLARAVEIASGMPYARFVEENIFKPLGMNESGYGFQAQSSLPLATPYAGSRPFSTYPAAWSLDVFYGAGGIVSSAHDMGLWMNGLLSRRLLDSEGLSQLWSAGRLSNGNAVSYAMGFVPTTMNGHRE